MKFARLFCSLQFIIIAPKGFLVYDERTLIKRILWIDCENKAPESLTLLTMSIFFWCREEFNGGIFIYLAAIWQK